MDTDTNLRLSLSTGPAMIAVAAVAVVYWLRISQLPWRWLWIGVALWTVAVVVKFAVAIVINGPVIALLNKIPFYPAYILLGGLFIGIQSSLCEMGFTWLAAKRWPLWGQDADRAIGIGTGAGAFEAFLLGVASLLGMIAALAHTPGTEPVGAALNQAAALTPLVYLVGPAERIIAILCHASCRALVLLGVGQQKPLLVFWGFLIFTLLDSAAGAAQLSGLMSKISLWWIELNFSAHGPHQYSHSQMVSA